MNNNLFSAAFKVIKGWLPPAAVKKIKFLTKSNMNEYVAEDQMLEDWGGTDDWQYAWLPESVEGKILSPAAWPRVSWLTVSVTRPGLVRWRALHSSVLIIFPLQTPGTTSRRRR